MSERSWENIEVRMKGKKIDIKPFRYDETETIFDVIERWEFFAIDSTEYELSFYFPVRLSTKEEACIFESSKDYELEVDQETMWFGNQSLRRIKGYTYSFTLKDRL